MTNSTSGPPITYRGDSSLSSIVGDELNDNVNSIQNFVSSFQRAQSFLGSNEFSPLQGEGIQEEAIIDEETNLLSPSLGNRRESIKSAISLINKQSTVYQTIFNCINTLIGIALLSLPYALKTSGLWLGASLLIASYLLTMETAKILGQVIRKHPELTTYGEIAGFCGGTKFQIFITGIFVTDVVGASLILTLLFSDTFGELFQLPKSLFKVLIISVTFVLSFLPLSILSNISLVGVICTFALLTLIVSCGLITSSQPGSLISPMSIPLYPSSFIDVIRVLGMFMAPWGGHPIFPQLYEDMRHPHKYSYACSVSFTSTIIVDSLIAVIGVLMFSDILEDSIIKNVMSNASYPNYVKIILTIIIGFLPVSKLPLLVKPIIRTFETHLEFRMGKSRGNLAHIIIRVGYSVFILFTSLLVESFGKVVSFLGAAICFTLCITLPFYFKLVVFGDELTSNQKLGLWSGVVVGIVGGILGTIGSFI